MTAPLWKSRGIFCVSMSVLVLSSIVYGENETLTVKEHIDAQRAEWDMYDGRNIDSTCANICREFHSASAGIDDTVIDVFSAAKCGSLNKYIYGTCMDDTGLTGCTFRASPENVDKIRSECGSLCSMEERQERVWKRRYTDDELCSVTSEDMSVCMETAIKYWASEVGVEKDQWLAELCDGSSNRRLAWEGEGCQVDDTRRCCKDSNSCVCSSAWRVSALVVGHRGDFKFYTDQTVPAGENWRDTRPHLHMHNSFWRQEHLADLGIARNGCKGSGPGKPGSVYNRWWYGESPVDEDTDTLQTIDGVVAVETGWCVSNPTYNDRFAHFRAVFSGYVGFACVSYNGSLPSGCACSLGDLVLKDCPGVTLTSGYANGYWVIHAATETDCKADVEKLNGPMISSGTLDVDAPDSDCYRDTMNWPNSVQVCANDHNT